MSKRVLIISSSPVRAATPKRWRQRLPRVYRRQAIR